MSKFGKELVASAREALEIAEGKKKAGRVYDFKQDKIDVVAIRKKIGVSQRRFAETFGLAASAVRDWEQKRRSPDRMASALLRIIDHAPAVAAAALKAPPKTAAKIKPKSVAAKSMSKNRA